MKVFVLFNRCWDDIIGVFSSKEIALKAMESYCVFHKFLGDDRHWIEYDEYEIDKCEKKNIKIKQMTEEEYNEIKKSIPDFIKPSNLKGIAECIDSNE